MSDPIDPQPPDPGTKATQRLRVGVPEDPTGTQRLDLPAPLEGAGAPKPEAQGGRIAPGQTQPSARPGADGPPIRVQKQDQPALASGQTLDQAPEPRGPRSYAWALPLGLGVLILLGAGTAFLYFRGPSPDAPPPYLTPRTAPGPENEPPGVQVYLEQAKAGDAQAMRMLGVMYYYGLNVPQDREKGLYWYRQAAAKGSDVAQAELRKLELSGK